MIHAQYAETLSYLYSKLPMYQRDGQVAFKKDLDNINKLCWNLGLPQWQFPCIHIAGTNGKGSVASMLNSILMEAGYKTGLYTSPHLKDFTERIRLKGKPISTKAVVEFVRLHKPLIEAVEPSFFELTVAMAFDFFAEKRIDMGVIEVGLGGRLDSTNIVKPEISIITNISYDHQALLGNSLTEIAEEKAGIIKRYTPVVVGKTHPETDPVFLAKAGVMEAPLLFADQMYETRLVSRDLLGQTLEVWLKEENELLHTFYLDLPGNYQLENLNTVFAAVETLRADGWDISDKALVNGLKRVKKNSGLQGRMEVIGHNPTIICDTAHNVEGVREVMAQIKEVPHERLHIVWGMVSDKDHKEILDLLPKNASYYFVKPDVSRGLNALTLQLKAEGSDLIGKVCNEVRNGLIEAKKEASEDDLIFVGGSTFVVAEILAERIGVVS